MQKILLIIIFCALLMNCGSDENTSSNNPVSPTNNSPLPAQIDTPTSTQEEVIQNNENSPPNFPLANLFSNSKD